MTRAFILLPLALLAACDSEADVKLTNASVAEVANKVAETQQGEAFILPGKWKVSGSVDEISIPGMPAGMAESMKRQGQFMPGTESCITEADVKKPGPGFFSGNKSCRYDNFTMGGGKIDARMRCASGGHTQLTTMTGTYAPESYRMAMATAMETKSGAAPTGMEAMTMKLRIDGKRIGECTTAEYAASAKAMAEATAAMKVAGQ